MVDPITDHSLDVSWCLVSYCDLGPTRHSQLSRLHNGLELCWLGGCLSGCCQHQTFHISPPAPSVRHGWVFCVRISTNCKIGFVRIFTRALLHHHHHTHKLLSSQQSLHSTESALLTITLLYSITDITLNSCLQSIL